MTVGSGVIIIAAAGGDVSSEVSVRIQNQQISGEKIVKIATLTVNPSVDASVTVPHVSPDVKLRCSAPEYDPGGGGINVTRVMDRLGGECTALWTCGGHTGGVLEDLLNREGLSHRSLPISGATRENWMVFEKETGRQYRFVAPGPELTSDEADGILKEIETLEPAPDYLVISGSLPDGVGANYYARVVDAVPETTRVVLDASGVELQAALERGVYLVAPNLREMGQIAGREMEDDADIIEVSRGMIGEGQAEGVVTTLGAGGAVLVTRDMAEHLRTPTVPVNSKVGAGDSMTAGIVLGLANEQTLPKAVTLGNAAAAATVMTPGTKLCRPDDVKQLYRDMLGIHDIE